MPVASKSSVKIADEVWIVTALLHREQPARLDLTLEEIIERAGKEGIAGAVRLSAYVHIVQHCVANRQPNPGRYRMLFDRASRTRAAVSGATQEVTASGELRLFSIQNRGAPGLRGLQL